MTSSPDIGQPQAIVSSKRQRGFSLITALFLLVVVALLSVSMISLRNVQQSTLLYGVQGARAMLAARSGVEWGIYQAMVNATCDASSPVFSLNVDALKMFDIQVECEASEHTEGATTITVYKVRASAKSGTYGTLDYVYRSLQATVSESPP